MNLLHSLSRLCLLSAAFIASHVVAQPTGYLSTDQISGAALNASDRRVVVLIHGFTNSDLQHAPANQYEAEYWPQVVSSLQTRLGTSGVKLLLFHWENDASTGAIYSLSLSDSAVDAIKGDYSGIIQNIANDVNNDLPIFYDQAFSNATSATSEAWDDGALLAKQINDRCPDLRQIVFVAHSAGAWAGYKAATELLKLNPYVVIEVVLLDPFIPGVDGVSPLNTVMMSGLAQTSNRIYRLENYYAVDLTDGFIGTRAPRSTSQVFSWRSGRDVNGAEVDYSTSGLFIGLEYIGYYYGSDIDLLHPSNIMRDILGHDGPQEFYADTVTASGLSSIPVGLREAPLNFSSMGFFVGLINNTPLLPSFKTQPQTQEVNAGTKIVLSATVVSSKEITYQWYKDGIPVVGATTAAYSFDASSETSGVYVLGADNSNADPTNGGWAFSEPARVSLLANQEPNISYIWPPTLVGATLPQKQTIRIYGSGFTAGCTLNFNDGVSSYATRIPIFVSANELDYDIAVGLNPANWTVQVVNGASQSNLGYFSVVAAPAASVASLSVSLLPQSAVLSGAQWQVDGGAFHNSGDIVPNLAPGAHTVTCKAIAGYSTPAPRTVSVLGGQVASDTENYTAVVTSTYTLTLNATEGQGTISPSPTATNNSYVGGAIVQLSASANYGYHFTGWSGDLTGSTNPASLTIDGNKAVTANFAPGDPRLGTVTVTISPQAAADAGVTWGFNAGDFRLSGSSYTTFPATYLLTLHTVDGWLGSPNLVANVTAGATTNLTATFTADTTPGLLTVGLSPSAAVAAGAQWHINGGNGHASGASVSLAPGTYTVSFDALPGWTSPPDQTVTVPRGQTSVTSGEYSPPVGQPTITSIVPSVGPLAGGTPLVIRGSNFAPGTTVTIGGVAATNISVVSGSEITCTTPAGSAYGTAAIAVQTGSGSAIEANGFGYGIPRGNGIVLEGSVGGYVNATAAQGNYGYLGEGSTFRILDVSNASSPTPVGQVALPGLIQDIALFSTGGHQYAAVADADGGLQVIDVTNSASPILCGYYALDHGAYGVTVVNTIAYVGANSDGLVIIDLSDPSHPKQEASVSISGFSNRLKIVTANGIRTAYLISNGTLVSIDVTDPTKPALQGQTARVLSSWYNVGSITVAGSVAYLAGRPDNVQAVDISDPTHPTVLGTATANGAPSAVSAANGVLYAWDGGSLAVYQPSLNGTLQRLGVAFVSGQSAASSLSIAGGTALCAGGEHGLYLYDVSSASSPAFRGTFGATAGGYVGTAVIGTTLLAATQNSGLKLFDITNPAAPLLLSQYVSSFNAGFGGDAVKAVGNRAFFLGVGQVNILDISNPNAPGFYAYTSQSNFFVWDFQPLSTSSVLVAGADATSTPYKPAVGLLNLTNPTSPQFQNLIYLSTPAGGIPAMAANTAIACVAVPLASGHSSLAVFDDTQPTNLRQIGQLADVGAVPNRGLALYPDGKYLFVGCTGSGADLNWKIVDVSTSSAPTLISSTDVDSAVVGFVFSGNSAILATGKGVSIYDVSDPTLPKLTRTYSTPYPSSGIQIKGDDLFVSDLYGGVSTLAVSDINPPSVAITTPTSEAQFTASSATIDIGGTADDASGLVPGIVKTVSWSNSRGGGGTATGTTAWSASGVPLQPGPNVISISAVDDSGNSGTGTLTVNFPGPKQDQTITFSSIPDHTVGDPSVHLLAAASSGLDVAFKVLDGPASVSQDVLTLTGAGQVTIEASQSGNDSFNAAAPVDLTFKVAKSDQTIAFAPISDQQADAAPFPLTATSSSGLNVYFTAISGPAVVSDNVVTILGSGPVVINAWQPGNANFNPAASVQQSFAVRAVPQTINFGSLSTQRTDDAPFALNANASSGLPITYTIVNGPATLTGNIVTVTGAGAVTVRASQLGDATYAAAQDVERTFAVVAPPRIITQPSGQSVNAGQLLSLATVAAGTAPLSYQWRKAGTPIAGATDAAFSIDSTQPSDSGSYDVVVSNGVLPDAISEPAVVNVIPSGVAATQTLGSASLNTTGGTITVSNRFSYTTRATSLKWSVLLPSGWSLVSSDTTAMTNAPTAGAKDLVEWDWASLPVGPVEFSYTLNVPAGDLTPRSIAALARFQYDSTEIEITVKPDPLVVGFTHSADTDHDFRVSLLELTRVIELYNTRNGTTRTGCYAVQAGSEDGFAPDASRTTSASIALTTFHTADENHDGRIDLLELTRVIELYNFRSGTTRTGQYHVQAGTEDGFAPGP